MLCRLCVLSLLTFAAWNVRAADDEIAIRKRDPVAALRSYYAEVFPLHRDVDKNEFYKHLLFFAETMYENHEEFRKARPANTTRTKVSLAAAPEREIAGLSFQTRAYRHSDRNQYASSHLYAHGNYYICDIGNIRIVRNNGSPASKASEITLGALLIDGVIPRISWGAGAGGGEGGEDKLVNFNTYICDFDTTTCLWNRTPFVVSAGLLKLDNTFFSVAGPRTVIFLHDDLAIDRFVVLEDGKPQ